MLSRHSIRGAWILVLSLLSSYVVTHGKTFLTMGFSFLNYEAKK